jgi:anti-anti-sigma factor
VTRDGKASAAGGTEFEVTAEPAAGDAVLVRVAGELDLSTHERLREPLVGAAQAGKSVVVDLGDCAFIDSSGIRALLLGHEAVTRTDGGQKQLLVAAPQPQVQRVLDMTGVTDAITVHPSVDEALEALG